MNVMIRRVLYCVSACVFLGGVSIEAQAARVGRMVHFKLNDGTTVRGRLFDISDAFYVVRLPSNSMKTVFFSEIKPNLPEFDAKTVSNNKLQRMFKNDPKAREYFDVIDGIFRELPPKILEIEGGSDKKLAAENIQAEFVKAVSTFKSLARLSGFEKSHWKAMQVFDKYSEVGKSYNESTPNPFGDLKPQMIDWRTSFFEDLLDKSR